MQSAQHSRAYSGAQRNGEGDAHVGLTSSTILGGLAIKEATKKGTETKAAEKAGVDKPKKKKHAPAAPGEQRKKHADAPAWSDVASWAVTRLKATAAYISENGALKVHGRVNDPTDWTPLIEGELKAISGSDSNVPAPEAGAADYTAAAAGSGALHSGLLMTKGGLLRLGSRGGKKRNAGRTGCP